MNKVYTIDYINIGLLIASCIVAFIVPFELFLFAYGVLGPLHYLTEISWLHDKNYFATNKRDVILLILISFLLVLGSLKHFTGIDVIEIDYKTTNAFIFIAFGSSLFFAFIKNNFYKIVGVILVIMLSVLSDRMIVFFSVFLPTLVHVYVFTAIFMLYGALKNKSKPGYFSVLLHLAIPFALFYLFRDRSFVPASNYAKEAYIEFQGLNQIIISMLNQSYSGDGDMIQAIYHSSLGVAIMRFIAFAYTYHYLNWFSKTKVIGWHEIPRMRAILIIAVWIISVSLYAINYSLGFKWLFLLSFMHVLLEFPLNYVSFVGIFKSLFSTKLRTASS